MVSLMFAACLFHEGQNCSFVAPARRASLLIDAANYFEKLAGLLAKAKRSILIIGWDFDGRIKLGAESGELALGDFLRLLVEREPALEIRILIWSLSFLHAPGDPWALLFGAPWQRHPRIKLRLDRCHPFYGCQHQKIVCVDSAIVCTGGIDLTVGRKDTTRHRPVSGVRRNPDGATYAPVHDVQIMLDGEIARSIDEVARNRWQLATGEKLVPPRDPPDLWPSDVKADFENIDAAVALAEPGLRGRRERAECAALTCDIFKQARRYIYIEAQYFTARYLLPVLRKSLAAADGPEVILILTPGHRTERVEKMLALNRLRLLGCLKHCDPHNRLYAYYPLVSDTAGAAGILVHSKVIIADDQVMRVGSSNLNNRSVALDVECDVALFAGTPAQRDDIRRARDRLLAEHLGRSPGEVAAALAASPSLHAAIEHLNAGSRRLEPFAPEPSENYSACTGTWLMDPERPFRLLPKFLRAPGGKAKLDFSGCENRDA
jgi:phosphatidylserine/phosphatidylglycerophosphate/cardiolipin synthase-like enzyme